jgi:hypothetical protein
MKRIAIVVVVAAAIVTATSYVSAKIGYNAGLADAPGVVQSPDAAYIASVLYRLHAGDTAMAVEALETHLDSCLVYRWAYDRRANRFLSILRPTEFPAIPVLIGVVAQYRAKYPSAATDDRVKSAIIEVVNRYESLAPRQVLPN